MTKYAKSKASTSRRRTQQITALTNLLAKHDLKDQHGVWGVIEKTLSTQALHSLMFLLSPAECEATTGIPDRDMPAVGFQIKKLDGIEIAKSPELPAGDWDVMIIGLPSLDMPLLTIQKPAGVGEFKLAEALQEVDDALCYANTGCVISHQNWSDVTVRQEYGYLKQIAGLKSPHSITPRTWKFTSDLNAPTEIVPSYFSGIVAESSDVVSNIASWRCTGYSNTYYLNTNAVENKGIVYSRSLERRVEQVYQNFRTFGYSVIGAGTIPSAPTVFRFTASADNYILNGVPRTVGEMTTSPCYKSNAYDGAYVTAPFEGDSEFLGTISDRGVLTASELVIGTNGVQDIGTVLHTQGFYPAPNDAGEYQAATTRLAKLVHLDPAFTPTVTIFSGIDANATVSTKTVMGVEFTPTAGGSYSNFSMPAMPAENLFMEYARALQSAVQPAYPASANGAWQVIKDIASTAWDVFKTVAPILLTLPF
jgi:hypothetical protein